MWLSGTTTPPAETTSLSLQMFNANTGGPSDTSFNRAMFFNGLTDVTYPRSSGHLEHNSFAQSSKKASENKALTGKSSLNEVSGSGSENSDTDSSFAPKPTLEKNFVQPKVNHKSGKLDDQVATSPPSSEASTIKLKRSAHEQGRVGVRHFVHTPRLSHAPCLLQFELARMNLEGYVVTETCSSRGSGKENERNLAASSEQNHSRFDSHKAINAPPSFGMLAIRATSSLGASSPRSAATDYSTAETAGESGAEKDTARASCFADTLAKLEARVPPSSSSPLRRHVHPEWQYNDNVELEHSGPALRCPRPIRQVDLVALGRLFQMGIVDESHELELHGSAANDKNARKDLRIRLQIVSFFVTTSQSPVWKRSEVTKATKRCCEGFG